MKRRLMSWRKRRAMRVLGIPAGTKGVALPGRIRAEAGTVWSIEGFTFIHLDPAANAVEIALDGSAVSMFAPLDDDRAGAS